MYVSRGDPVPVKQYVINPHQNVPVVDIDVMFCVLLSSPLIAGIQIYTVYSCAPYGLCMCSEHYLTINFTVKIQKLILKWGVRLGRLV
jgi:hypothetical protein